MRSIKKWFRKVKKAIRVAIDYYMDGGEKNG